MSFEEKIDSCWDFEKLIEYLNKVSTDSKYKKRIEGQMVKVLQEKVLPEKPSFKKLANYWNNVYLDSIPEKLIEKAMPQSLSEISNVKELISYEELTDCNTAPRHCVCARFSEVVSEIDDFFTLNLDWERSSSKKFRSCLEVQMKEVLKKNSDLIELISYEKRVLIGTAPEELVQSRMFEILNSINSENVSKFEWFEDFANNPETLPKFIKKDFTQKLIEIQK